MDIAIRKEQKFGAVAIFLTLSALVWISNRHGLYYDDEIFTIRLLESKTGLISIVRDANSQDVHPPLGYVIDFLLYQATGNWKSVQCIAGLANALALALFAAMARPAMSRTAWRVLVGLLASSASWVMWGASLRWYAWFNPIFALGLATALWGRLGPLACAILLVGLGVILFHIGYLAVVASPLLGATWAWRYRERLDRKTIMASAAALSIGLALCLPQLVTLISVHMSYPGQQTGPLLQSLVQSGITVMIGNAVFPLGILPVLTAMVTGIALIKLLISHRRQLPMPALWLVLILGVAAMILTGLGYRARNNLYLTAAALPLIATALAALPGYWRIAALSLTGIFQLQGVWNVALHHGTMKRSFNTPFAEVIQSINHMAGDCPVTVLAQNDIVLGYLADSRLRRLHETAQLLKPGDCLIVVRGSAYDVGSTTFAAWLSRVSKLPLKLENVEKFEPEPAVALAGRLTGKQVEDHAAVIDKYRAQETVVIPFLID